jgi:hypothetical protein
MIVFFQPTSNGGSRERLGVSADEMPGGHLVALSQPAELAARLIAYADDSLAG